MTAYRSLLVPLDAEPPCAARTAFALRLAADLDCHPVGLAPTGLLDFPAAADLDADLIVIDAYGRARLTERLLGGATRGRLASMRMSGRPAPRRGNGRCRDRARPGRTARHCARAAAHRRRPLRPTRRLRRPIDPARLLAQPTALRCVACQTAAEQDLRVRSAHAAGHAADTIAETAANEQADLS